MSFSLPYIGYFEESDEENDIYGDWTLGLGDWDPSDDCHDESEVPSSQQSNHNNIGYFEESDEENDIYGDWIQGLGDWDPSDDYHDESEVPSSQQSNHNTPFTFLLIIKRALKWGLFKWIFIVLNVVIEVCQATLTQENALGKISTPLYMKLSVVTSCLCLMISLVEAIHEGKESKVVWQRRGCLGWFYYPGRQRQLFGRFSLVFGVVSSMIQFCVNLLAVMINKSFVKFETLPLFLSIAYLVAALVDHGGKDMVRCEAHGRCVEQCSGCKADASVLTENPPYV